METNTISGIVIVVPDIPVTNMLDQLTLIHLNIQQKVSICTSSFWIGLDIRICEGKLLVDAKCAHIPLPFVTLVTSTNKSVHHDICIICEIGKKWETIFEYSMSMPAFCAAKIHDNNYSCYTYNNHKKPVQHIPLL